MVVAGGAFASFVFGYDVVEERHACRLVFQKNMRLIGGEGGFQPETSPSDS